MIPGGTSTYSKQADRFPASARRRCWGASGPYIWLGNRGGSTHIDYTSALGAVILGYAHPEVEAMVDGLVVHGVTSVPTPYEQTLAERLASLMPDSHEWMVRFAKNGSDVTSAAVRLARAVTGRAYVVTFEGSYHGSQDWSMTLPPKNGGVPVSVRGHNLKVPLWNRVGIESLFQVWSPAAIVLEPLTSSSPLYPPAGFWAWLRQTCDRYGVLIVLDEIISGLRYGVPGMVHQLEGCVPDLACYAKALGNGRSVTALVGRRSYMERITQDVFMSGTFASEVDGLAAGLATLDVCQREDVPARLAERGEQLRAVLIEAATAVGLAEDAVRIIGHPARLLVQWTDPVAGAKFNDALAAAGVLSQGYFNLTLAHSRPEIVRHTDAAIRSAMRAVANPEAGCEQERTAA